MTEPHDEIHAILRQFLHSLGRQAYDDACRRARLAIATAALAAAERKATELPSQGLVKKP